MKRLRRIIYNALTVLSLLLCVAMVGLWVRSYAGGDTFWITRRWLTTEKPQNHLRNLLINSERGGMKVGLSVVDSDFVPVVPQFEWNWERGGFIYAKWPPPKRKMFDLNLSRPHYGLDSALDFDLLFPHWIGVLTSSILPSVFAWRLRSRRLRVRTGLCSVCSYDLRATPDRCPECGAIPNGM